MLYWNVLILLLCIRICVPQILSYTDDTEEPDFVMRVVNGWPAKLGEAPYQLAFKGLRSRQTKTYYTFCGGSIIGKNKVLSAAHCFEEKKKGCKKCWGAGEVSKNKLERTFAVAGNLANEAKYNKLDSLENGQWRRLKSMILAPGYVFPENDICVGYTTVPFEFNSNVAPISYAITYREYVGKCLAAGYGRTSTQSKESSDVLLLAHLQLLTTSWCSKIHQKNMRKFVCTSSTVSDVHKGDSGGPLVCAGTQDPDSSGKGVVVGVVSGNRRRAGTFFTRVSSFRKFIDEARGFAACTIRNEGSVFFMILLYSILLF